MGIKQLSTWVRKNHPSALIAFPQRFAAPDISGKKIAIDATLLTNRFHFADRDNDLKGKGALVGWYNLISEMRAHGVQPIAIWDERGERPWKAPEARKRLEARLTAIARKSHEERRMERLQRARREVLRFRNIGKLEQAMIQENWERTRFCIDEDEDSGEFGVGKEETLDSSQLLTAANLPTHNDQATPSFYPTLSPQTDQPHLSLSLILAAITLAHVGEVNGRLTAILKDYRASNRPYRRRLGAVSNTDVLEAVTEAEAQSISGETGQNNVTENGTDARSSGADIAELKLGLPYLLPAFNYTEAPRQSDLTEAEGEIYNSLFTKRDMNTLGVDDAACLDALNGLDELLIRAPEVKRTYDRAVAMPLERDHNDCRTLLEKMGVPVLTAMIPYEAEGLAAALALAGVADYVGTEDSDVIVYGGPLLRNIGSSRQPLVLFNSARLRTLVNLPEESFRDFCILLGNDASPRIPNVGPVRAAALIKKFRTIEGILEGDETTRKRISDVDNFMALIKNARSVFADLPPIDRTLVLEQGTFDDDDVVDWMKKEHGVSFFETSGPRHLHEENQNTWGE